MKTFRVATYAHKSKTGRLFVNAYTRTYSEDWHGCVVYDVLANSGSDAKKEAIRRRMESESAKEKGCAN